MSADSFAAATDMVSRSAAAYAAAIPEHPGKGYFGPASVAWRLSLDLASPIAGLRSLLIQALHPLAMAGVDQHSDWRRDPVGRLAATSGYLTAVMFGERGQADRLSAVVQRIHERVVGVDGVTGRPYEASDPDLLLWVHVAFAESGLAVARLFGAPLTAAEEDAYAAEMVVAAELVGVPADMVPSTAAGLAGYIEAARPELRCTPAASESMSYLREPAGMEEDIAEIWREIWDAAVASLPGWARDMYGYALPYPAPATMRTQIRQALGVLDAFFLAEPGVLEARQRIAAAMRSAPAA